MRVGIAIKNSGEDCLGFVHRAQQAEAAGFDTVWMSDHTVNPSRIDSHYPYDVDGKFNHPQDALG